MKLFGLKSSLLLSLLVCVFLLARQHEEKVFLHSELTKKGESLVQVLAISHRNVLETHNWKSLYQLVSELKRSDPDIVEIAITDVNNIVRISSDAGLVGALFKENSKNSTEFSKAIETSAGFPIAVAKVVLSQTRNQMLMRQTMRRTWLVISLFTVLSFLLLRMQQQTVLREQEQHLTANLIAGMASTLAHSLKNPLGLIHAHVPLLKAAVQSREWESAEKSSDLIASEVGRMFDTIAKLNDAAPRPIQFSVCRATMILDLALARANIALQPNVKIVKNYDAALPTINADVETLQICFTDLIENAAQAMPNGGVLTVSATLSPENKIRIGISDTGIGMNVEQQEKIFTPFFTTKKTGTGLGLWSAKRVIAEIHHGTLDLQSQLGVGSEVIVTLPCVVGEKS